MAAGWPASDRVAAVPRCSASVRWSTSVKERAERFPVPGGRRAAPRARRRAPPPHLHAPRPLGNPQYPPPLSTARLTASPRPPQLRWSVNACPLGTAPLICILRPSHLNSRCLSREARPLICIPSQVSNKPPLQALCQMTDFRPLPAHAENYSWTR